MQNEQNCHPFAVAWERDGVVKYVTRELHNILSVIHRLERIDFNVAWMGSAKFTCQAAAQLSTNLISFAHLVNGLPAGYAYRNCTEVLYCSAGSLCIEVSRSDFSDQVQLKRGDLLLIPRMTWRKILFVNEYDCKVCTFWDKRPILVQTITEYGDFMRESVAKISSW